MSLRSVFQQLDLLSDAGTVHREEQKAAIQDDGADVALVKGGSVLAARNLVELGMSPGAIGRMWLFRLGRWCGLFLGGRRLRVSGDRHIV
jgi:hypothetical protein